MSDISACRPTVICGVPRVFTRIVSGMQEKISKLPFLKRLLVETILKQKKNSFLYGKQQSFICDLILNDFRQALGGRVRLIVSGGAPILPETYEFMKLTLSPLIIQGYGLTECAAGLAVQQYPETNIMVVGAVSITSECKLRRIMDYDPRGPVPCGELLVRGPHVFKEYYKEPELTHEAKIDGEWFATGDIIRLTDDGLIQIIDRAKQLVKLSQGEYLSLTTLNETYTTADGVANIYIYADSHHDFIVAAVVPTPILIERWKSLNIFKPNDSPIAKEVLLAGLKECHLKNRLRGFERIERIYIDLEDFTIENGLLTPSMKPQWQALRKKYEFKMIELLNQK